MANSPAECVHIDLVIVNYLLHPPQHVPARHGAGIAVIVIYFLILLPMAVSYFRVLQVVVTNPGYVTLAKPERSQDEKDGSKSAHGMEHGFLDRRGIWEGRVPPPPGLEHFLDKDVFECDIDGYPRWCSSCKQWKPDRSHHSSELGRCVHKMDHFCPWCVKPSLETTIKGSRMQGWRHRIRNELQVLYPISLLHCFVLRVGSGRDGLFPTHTGEGGQ